MAQEMGLQVSRVVIRMGLQQFPKPAAELQSAPRCLRCKHRAEGYMQDFACIELI